jgi:hypothetical protein
MMPRLALVVMIIVGALLGAFFPRSAWAVDHSLSGSVQLDYHFVPTAPDANARSDAFDGFTTEATVKLTADISDHLSAGVKICFGCHGFEADMAYAEYRFGEAFGIRAGRFSPSFGAFNLRHDPANHGLSSKPLPYDMGRMLRMSTWNMSVLPSPFPDNGVEVGGSLWPASEIQLDYAAYAVSGFKAGNDATDLDWVQSRSPSLYYVDNNGRPTVGGRLATTARLGSTSDLTVGASAMYGTFNPANTLTYAIVGGDFSVRVDKTTLRAEYLVRRQQFDASDPTRFKYSVSLERGDFTTKHGAYVEIEQGVTPLVSVLGRVDGMARYGNVEATSLLSDGSTVERLTLGALLRFEHSLRLKVSTELWKFSDNDLRGQDKAVSIHTAVVGAF